MKYTEKKKTLNSIVEMITLRGWLLKLIRSDYNGDVHKTRKIENIRTFFGMNQRGDYTLDDQTWKDLDMDRVFEFVISSNHFSIFDIVWG